jgi:predicted RecA/RadA family phage recombinase
MASGPAKFVQEGGSIDYTPGADVLVGAVVVQADLIGVTQAPIKGGQLGSLAVTGVFDFNKAGGAGSAIPAGTLTYWDAAAQNATKNAAAGANKLIGKAVKATVDADTIVRVRLQQ